MQSYKTVSKFGTDQFTEQRSRFIGYCKPVTDEKSAIDFINEIKQKHWDAKHNVYAYVLKNGTARFSDDGEPQSTAGMPVLDVIKKEGVSDVCVVVTRYFGGILLGTGGLVRAYSKGAKIAINASETVSMVSGYKCTVECDYNMYSKINSCFLSNDCRIENSWFEENISLWVDIPENKFDEVDFKLKEISSGICQLKIIEKCFIENKG